MSDVTIVKASVAFTALPVWGRLETCMAISGLPDNVIRGLYNTGKIRARKTDPAKANSACVYRVQDILDWLDTEAASPKKFALPGA